MKLCLIGVFSGDLDEGYKNIASNISHALSEKYDVHTVDTNSIFSLDTWNQIKEFKPDIIHYFTAPTFSSFIILKLFKMWCKRDVKLVISALNPYCLKLSRIPFLKVILSLFKPDIILTQCTDAQYLFEHIGMNTTFLPNGVDIDRFISVKNERKIELRKKYGIKQEQFVILHVGHIRETRGIKLLNKIQNDDEINQVIIIGSSYFKINKPIYNDLQDGGCLIWMQFFKNIEEIYALTDCYVFPTPLGESIFMPLSVLEAMSCNIPVISTKFEGLVDNFEEDKDLMFFTHTEDLNDKIEYIKNTHMETTCRNKIESWDNICSRLEIIYSKLLVQVNEA